MARQVSSNSRSISGGSAVIRRSGVERGNSRTVFPLVFNLRHQRRTPFDLALQGLSADENDCNGLRECWLGGATPNGATRGMAAVMAPCFAAADLFFLSSREDPFPTTVPEIMAYGLPGMGFAGSGLG
jgi:hypothetical protein